MDLMREMPSYPFLMRVLAGGMMVSLYTFLLGVSLVLRRYSMIEDGLSHIPFRAPSIALAMGWFPLRISIPVVVLAAFFLLRVTEDNRIKSDTAIALMSASALALGIIVTSLIVGITTDVSSYMFGSILAMSREDVWLSVVLSLVVLGLFATCYNRIFVMTLDKNFVKAVGVNVGRYNIIITVLTIVTIVLGTRVMGAMLIPSLVIFPCLPSMRVFKSLGDVMVFSGTPPLTYFFTGMVVSYQFSVPAEASVVVVSLCTLLLFMTWQSLGCLRS